MQRRSELEAFQEESRFGSSLPLDQFNYFLPGPNGPIVSSIIENPARNYELETKRLQVAQELLSEEDQVKIVEEAVKAEQNNFQTGRKFLKGFEGSYLNSYAGIQRMLGNNEEADDIQLYLNDPHKERSNRMLMQMAQKVAPKEAKKLEEELDTGVVGDLAEGAGQLVGQVGMVGTASTINPILGFATLATQVAGQNFEGNYQRSKNERLERLFGEYSFKGLPDKETLQQKLDEVDEQAKADATSNLWTALPEMFFDRLGLKMAGKFLKGKSSGVDKVATFTIGAMAEGASEGTSSLLQNYMVKNKIDPEQEVTEGVLYDIFLGTTLGASLQGVSGVTGEFGSAGVDALLGDVQDFRKQVIKRAKKEAKQGSKKAKEFLDQLDQAMSQDTAYNTGGVVTSVSAQGSGDGMSVEGVEKTVSKLHSEDGAPVHVLPTFSDLKDFDSDLAKNLGDQDGIEGFYDPKNKRIVMFADQLETEADVERVLRHEKIGHMGNEAVTGNTGKAFYQMIGMQYADTELGQKILRNYGDINLEVLGKEIVARVSENPNLAPKGLRETIVDKFHSLTGNTIEATPENDQLIVNSIALAEQVVDSPDVFKKLEGANTRLQKDVQDEENPYFSKDVTKRIPQVREAYYQLKNGEIDKAQYDAVVSEYKPVVPYAEVPPPATFEQMHDALDAGKKEKIADEFNIFEPGQRVGLRLDIPAYIRKNVWVPTMHGINKLTGRKDKSHNSVARITNADFTDVVDRYSVNAERIMEGPEVHGKKGDKNPYAQVMGEYVPTSPAEVQALAQQALNDPAWTQVGFDPQRHSYFYDRKDHSTMIVSADEVLQIGPLVLAKNAVKKQDPDVRFSIKDKKVTELKSGMTRDSNGNLYYKGVPPQEWTDKQFKEVGDIYGIKNFGPLTKPVTVKDEETGKTYKLPGGLEGKFTYFDLLWIKANQPTISHIGEKTHAKITAKLAKSLTPDNIDQVDHFNRLAFGFLSPNAPLLPNEFGLARVLARDKSDLQKLADLGKDYPKDGSVAEKNAWNYKVKAKFDIGSEGAGGLGIGLTQDFGLLSNFARLYLKDPSFFIKKSDESWSFFVDRVASQVPGFGTKTASFAGVWQDPFNAMISAIDRHMASNFAEEVLQDPDLKNRYENLIVKKFNEEVVDAQAKEKKYEKEIQAVKDKASEKLQSIEETRLRKHERAKSQAVKDKADEMAERQVAKEKERLGNRLEKMGAKRKEDLEGAVDPTIPKVETLDDVMAMVKQIGYDKVSTALGKATLAGMSAKGAVYKNKKTGKVNENLSKEWQQFEGFIEDPAKLKIMSDAYKSALDINEKKASDLGIPVFPAQWTLWDRIRGRVEPHEIMFPNLNLLPRMGREQIQETYNMSRSAGYNRAPQTIAKTNVAPSRFVYFSKKDSEPDSVTGMGKFTVRLQADESLPAQIRDNLDPEYTVQAHSEVLEQIKPWFGTGKINYENKAKDLLVELDQQNLTPEGKMLAGQILVKALGRQADALRGRLGKKDKNGQLKFDGIVDTNKLDDLAISLATRLAEEARTYGRAVSILQEYGNLRGMALSGVAKKAITNAVIEKVKTEGVSDQQVNDLTEIIRVASEAGFDAISVEFLRKKAPDLVKIIEKQFAPSLWGAYRKDAVNKIYGRVMSALNKQGGSQSTAPLARFTNELVAEIQRRINLKPGAKKKLRPKAEVLRDALLNAEKYKDVWKGLAKQIKDDKTLTDSQRAELEDLFGQIPEVSGQLVESTINERMKAFDIKLNKLVREHIGNRQKTSESLTKAIMAELDLPSSIAIKMSMRIQGEFNRKMREEAKKQIDTFKKKSNAPKLVSKVKGLEQFVIEMSNLGAFDRTDVYNELGKRMGIKGTFDTGFARRIQQIAFKIQNAPEGFQKNDLVQDLLSEIQNRVEEGSKWSALGTLAMAIRQANLVSGVSTQLINLTSNIATMGGMATTQAMRSGFNPNIMYTMFRNMMHGLTKGKDEAKQVILTGRGRRGFEMDKHAFDPILERKTLKGGKLNPYNYLKHVHRFMSALDTMFRFTNIEGKASFLSAMEAKKKGLSGKALRDYVNESLKNTEGYVNSAKAQASREGLTGLNHTRRVNEIVESLRDPDIKQESEQYGLRSTYQNVPEGLLGAMASWVAQGAYPPQAPGTITPPAKQIMGAGLQFFIPFIRVVANVQNMTFDYTPIVGATRAVWHKYGKGSSVRKNQPYSEEAYQDLMARNLLGTALAGTLGYLFFREEDDEENRMFDITGPGPLNLQKRNALIESGWKPYSITWNGKQIGYKETPFGGFLAFMGGIKDAKKYEDEQPTQGNLITAGTMAFGRLMFDQAFFKGVSDGIAITKFDQMSSYFLERTIKGAPKQFLIPNLFNQVDNAIHNKKYTTGDLTSKLGHELNHVIPFQRGDVTLDPFGQPVRRYNGEADWDNFFARVFDQEQRDSLTKKLSKHGIIPTRPNKGTDIRSDDDELSDLHRAQDLYLYNEIKGRHLKAFLERFDTSQSEQGVQSRIDQSDSKLIEAVYKKLNSSAGRVAKSRVRQMNRAEVLVELGRIRKSFKD